MVGDRPQAPEKRPPEPRAPGADRGERAPARPVVIADVLRLNAEARGEQPGFVLDGVGELTYGEWDRRANRLARRLQALGVGPGDPVGLLLSNREGLAYAIGYFAIHKAGGVAVPINVRLSPGEIAHIVGHSEAVGVLAEARFADRLAEGRAASPSCRWAVVAGSDEGYEPAEGDLAWDEALADVDGSPVQVPRSPEDLADILYTSGTTGTPKAVAASHHNVLSVDRPNPAFAGLTFLHAIPLFTFAGTHGMLHLAMRHGMTAVVQPRFDAGRFLELIEERRVVMSYAVPAMIMLLLDHPSAGHHDNGSLRVLMYGTAPMPPEGVRRLGAIFPGTFLVNLYGLTEGGGAVCSLSPEEAQRRPDSIGKPVRGTELRIAREDGSEAEPGEMGEIWMRTASRRRYHKDEAATDATWTEDGWLRTGDAGYRDAEGFLYLGDRKKDLIIRGGFNVYPAEVEAALFEHPAVAEAAVVAMPHRVLGEDVAAYVALKPGATADPAELAAHCRERLADYKQPRRIEVLDTLPRNALGKVLKRDLRERAASAPAPP